MAIAYLFTPGVPVEDPSSEGVPPVLDQIRLCVLLTLAVSEAALRLEMRHQVLRVQFHLQEFTHRLADDFFGTPGAAVFLLANSETVRTETVKMR